MEDVWSQVSTWSRLRAAHIFPCAHFHEISLKPVACSVTKRVDLNLVTDVAPQSTIGGYSKIDCIQNERPSRFMGIIMILASTPT